MSFSTEIQSALTAWRKKDAANAVQALERGLVLARAAAPLDVRQAVVIHHPHTGLGLYTPAPGQRLQGRHGRLYVEVANHHHAPTAEPGLLRVQLEVRGDFSYEDRSEGELQLLRLPTVALGTQQYETRTAAGVTSFGVELSLGDKAPAGTYRLRLLVTDVLGEKSASRDTTFVVA